MTPIRYSAAYVPQSTGAADRTGSASQTLDLLTQSAAGAVAVTGAAAETLDLVTQSAADAVTVTGVAAETLDLLTQSASGTVGTAADRTGSADQTLDLLTQAASGTVSGAAAQVFGGGGGSAVSRGELQRIQRLAKASADDMARRREDRDAFDRMLAAEMAEAYDRLTGAAPERAAEIVAPFAEPAAERDGRNDNPSPPPAAAIDFAALAADVRAVRAMIAAYAAAVAEAEEEDELTILLLAA